MWICGSLWLSMRPLLFVFAGANAALIPPHLLPLSTANGKIVSSVDGSRQRLLCANWYGAHMEQHAVAGLQVRSLSEISAEAVRLGLNCIRLPMSLEMWYMDPPIRAEAVAGDAALLATPNLTATTLLDRTVEAMAAAGLAVLLNNHNSASGWCCDVDSEEGLWSTRDYNASLWVRALGGLAARYRHIPLVVGIDLRNEIHDAKPLGRFITWGTSTDIDEDWKVATEAAAAAIHAVDPELLLLVSGLCFSFDLRLLVADPPLIPIPNKLVYTTHYYAWSRWWTRVPDSLGMKWDAVASTSRIAIGICLPAAMIVLILGLRALRAPVALMSVGAWVIGVSCACAVVAKHAAILHEEAGCVEVGRRIEGPRWQRVAVHTGWVGGMLVFLGWFLCFHRSPLAKRMPQQRLKDRDQRASSTSVTSVPHELHAPHRARRVCTTCCCVNLWLFLSLLCGGCFALLQLAKRADSYQMFDDELTSKWSLEQAHAPVFVGEFGTGLPNEQYWTHITRFLHERQLDYAYWSLNGDLWSGRDDFDLGPLGFTNEWFGLLKPDYRSIRHPSMLTDLQLHVAYLDPPSPPLSPPPPPLPPFSPGLANIGRNCWHPCGAHAGVCNDFCGEAGACCRLGMDDTLSECSRGVGGCRTFHCCVKRPEVAG